MEPCATAASKGFSPAATTRILTCPSLASGGGRSRVDPLAPNSSTANALMASNLLRGPSGILVGSTVDRDRIFRSLRRPLREPRLRPPPASPLPMTRNLDRRLTAITAEVSALRAEVAVLAEQVSFQRSVAEETEVRALVAE